MFIKKGQHVQYVVYSSFMGVENVRDVQATIDLVNWTLKFQPVPVDVKL